jgi:hypothetical protein
MRRIERVFHPWNKCEEFGAGMWRKVSGEEYQDFAMKAADLMRNPEKFKKAMAEVVANWPMSAEHNLTAIECNRRAWLGHAGCLTGVGSPEEPTRIGWHQLTKAEQFEADRVAQEVIDAWEKEYIGKGQMFLFPDLKPKGRTSTDA